MPQTTTAYEVSENTKNREELARRIKIDPGLNYYFDVKNQLLRLNVSDASLENVKLLKQIANNIIPDLRRARSFYTEPLDPVEREGLKEVKDLEGLIKKTRRTMIDGIKKRLDSVKAYEKKELNVSEIDYLKNLPAEISDSIRLLCCKEAIDTKKVDDISEIIRNVTEKYHENKKRGRELISDFGFLSAKSDYSITLNDKTINDNPFVMSPKLLNYVQENTKEATTDKEKAKAIFDMIRDYVKYGENNRGNKNYKNADETFKTKEGVCGEMAYLYVAAARVAGLKSNLVDVIRDDKGEKVCHACASVKVDGKIILIDPAYYTMDVKHKKFRILNDSEARERYKLYNGLEDKVDITIEDKEHISLSEEERSEAIKTLSRQGILYQIKQILGLVIAGEDEAKLLTYLACTSSRLSKLIQPINILIQSPTSSGKTHLVTNVGKLFPKEVVMQATRFSSRGIEYIEDGLDGKIIAIEEYHALPDDVRRSMLPTMWKSKTKTYVPVIENGKRVTKASEVLGNPAYILASSKDFWDEEINRGILIWMTVSDEQNKKIRELKERNSLFPNKSKEEFEEKVEKYVNCYLVTEPKRVVMPFGLFTSELIAGVGGAAYGRNEEKLESIVQTIANLSQYNEKRSKLSIEGKEYIIASLSDLYYGTRLVKPFFEESFTCIDAKSRAIYHLIKNSDNGEISQTGLANKLQALVKRPGSILKDITNKESGSSLALLYEIGLIAKEDGSYSVNREFSSRFNINGLNVDIPKLNSRFVRLNEFDPNATKNIGLEYNGDKTFAWNKYRENVTDPITGEELQIYVRQLDNEKGVLKVEKL